MSPDQERAVHDSLCEFADEVQRAQLEHIREVLGHAHRFTHEALAALGGDTSVEVRVSEAKMDWLLRRYTNGIKDMVK